jgi:hypothetical protein
MDSDLFIVIHTCTSYCMKKNIQRKQLKYSEKKDQFITSQLSSEFNQTHNQIFAPSNWPLKISIY